MIAAEYTEDAENDILDAARWYQNQRRGLGTDFLDAVARCEQFIVSNPTGYQIIVKDIRRAMLKRFPYGLFYVVREHRVIVIACFHAKRDPQLWITRTTPK